MDEWTIPPMSSNALTESEKETCHTFINSMLVATLMIQNNSQPIMMGWPVDRLPASQIQDAMRDIAAKNEKDYVVFMVSNEGANVYFVNQADLQ